MFLLFLIFHLRQCYGILTHSDGAKAGSMAIMSVALSDCLLGGCTFDNQMLIQLSTIRRTTDGLLRNQKFQSVAIGFVHWAPDRCCCKIELHFDSKLISRLLTNKKLTTKTGLLFWENSNMTGGSEEYQSFFPSPKENICFVRGGASELSGWYLTPDLGLYSPLRTRSSPLPPVSQSRHNPPPGHRRHSSSSGSGSGSSVSAQSWLGSRSANSAAISRSALQRSGARGKQF